MKMLRVNVALDLYILVRRRIGVVPKGPGVHTDAPYR